MQILKTSGKVRTLLIAALLGLGTTAGLSACDEGPMEEAGEEVDDAADLVADEAEDAADEAGDAFED